MKNILIVLGLVFLWSFSHATREENEIDTPRILDTYIATTDTAQMNKLLMSLIREYEGEFSDVTYHFSADSKLCAAPAAGQMTCSADYISESWSGFIKVEFKVEYDKVVEIRSVEIDGGY